MALLHDPAFNKGTAFTEEERDLLGLRGLLPPRVQTAEQQVARVKHNLDSKPNDLEKYIALIGLQDRNERLFYRFLAEHLETMMPIVYTPTVGLACERYGQIFRRPRGLYVTIEDAGRVGRIVDNWQDDASVVVVTDGERILGLGDLGANGMGIPVGKLALYTACAGFDPLRCLPITLDVGTENEALLADPLYLGLKRRRTRDERYDALVEELVGALNKRWPGLLIQFEDFGNNNAFRLLERYRGRVLTFNDDIQGTAAVAVAGLVAALRLSGTSLREQRLLFFGAGEAGTGIAELFVAAAVQDGMAESDARRQCWLFDSRGLVTSARNDGTLAGHKVHFAHEHAPASTLLDAVEALRPTALIGTSTQANAFSDQVLSRMASLNQRPIVFALSNPTAKAECTAEAAVNATGGRVIFASGSPFPPLTFGGRRIEPGQGNNVYVFPGIGLGVVAARSRLVTDEMFLAAARALAAEVGDDDLAVGRVFPRLSRVREVSVRVACAVAQVAFARGLATAPPPHDLDAHVRSLLWSPAYPDYAAAPRA
ncbi:MAG: NAD-dependent malic enzyme [Deltaproteobacteria bacterium]|nr:NAD-dependent malic enzyme [Deltaproteobacteria bacterium]